jgi:hypothetical protein
LPRNGCEVNTSTWLNANSVNLLQPSISVSEPRRANAWAKLREAVQSLIAVPGNFAHPTVSPTSALA